MWFFREHTHLTLVCQLRLRTPFIILLPTLIALSLITPVAAAPYLDFHYFETDKTVYVVGEKIDMVSKLIADFDEGGWCYISFTVVADNGPIFSEEKFISASSNVRYLTASYTILPDDVSPGMDIETAYVIFNIEIFDKYSQSISESVEVNITKGPLAITTMSQMDIEYGLNTTLAFRLASSINETIAFSNQNVSITIFDEDSIQIFHNDTVSNLSGEVMLDWNSMMGLPGMYNVCISSNGSNSFLPISNSFPLEVLPASSNLNIIQSTDRILCQSSDGNHFESVQIIVNHVNQEGIPIEGSTVQWETNFSNGTMSHIVGGQFEVYISFQTSPGFYQINLTAVNPLYQNGIANVSIEVLPRNISINTQLSEAKSGDSLNITIELIDWHSSTEIEFLPVNVSFSIGSSHQNLTGISNASGMLSLSFQISPTNWGEGTLIVYIAPSTYYDETIQSLNLDVLYIPNIEYNELIPATIGYNTSLIVNITNPNGQPVQGRFVEIINSLDATVATGYSNSSGMTTVTWLITPQYGLLNFTIFVSEDYSSYVYQSSKEIQIHVYYPLFFHTSNSTWNLLRGNNTMVEILLDTNNTINQSVNILFTDSLSEFSLILAIPSDTNSMITFPLDYNVSDGPRIINITILDIEFVPIGEFQISGIVFSLTISNITNMTASYSEAIYFDITSINDINETIDEVTIEIFLADDEILLALIENTNTSMNQFFLLPNWIQPGFQQFICKIYTNWSLIETKIITIFIWMPTTISIAIVAEDGGQLKPISPSIQILSNTSKISSGSIMSPPPILFNGTTSVESSTTLDTSPTSCPKLSSGTNNLSTDSANTLIAWSGNGQMVLSLRDLNESSPDFSMIDSSTDLDVLPNETIPHFAVSGPDTITSVRFSILS